MVSTPPHSEYDFRILEGVLMATPGSAHPAPRILARALRWGLLFAAPFAIASCSTHRGSESEVQAATSQAKTAAPDTTLAPDFSLPDLKG